jgi:regulator of nonsense transcripts 2
VDDESDRESTFDEEAIVVKRQEEQVDPEDEADFEREYAKMMAESLESRKFERKQLFDVPLPVRPKNREASASGEASTSNGQSESPAGNTMAFSLLTKRGNRQQVWKHAKITSVVMLTTGDTNRRTAFGFDVCSCYEEPAAG